ncbi:MAG: hypothetical protein ACK4NS_07950 [Saprospiraceae bacterium]
MRLPYVARYIAAALLCLLGDALGAQPALDAQLEPAHLETGDAFQLVVSVPINGPRPDMLDLSAWQTVFPPDQIIGRTGWFKAGDSLVQRIHIVALDSGRFELPPVALLMSDGSRRYSQPLYLSVQEPPPPQGMADIRDIISAPINGLRWLFIGAAALAVLALILLLGRRMRRRKRATLTNTQTLKLNPAERAKVRLHKLRDKRLAQSGQFKGYYLELSAILREYMHDSGALPGPDATTEMLAPMLAPLDPEAKIITLLRRADLVKFAKAMPDAAQAEADWELCAAWIEDLDKKRA